MRPSIALCFRASRARLSVPPLVHIQDATFYRRQPSSQSSQEESSTNPAIFPNLNFSLPADAKDAQHWAIIGPSNAGKTTFLEILQGKHLSFPPTSRLFPYLSSDVFKAEGGRLSYPSRAFQYVGFNARERGLSGIGSHLSARYESHREATDFSVRDFLTGNTELNADPSLRLGPDETHFRKVVEDLKLKELLDMPVSNLSNGQTRRARIAKALLSQPEVLLLDEPFMGLDPPTTVKLNPLLRKLAHSASPRLLLALRPQDPIPDWITHVMYLGEDLKVTHQGLKADVDHQLVEYVEQLQQESREDQPNDIPNPMAEFGRVLTDIGIVPRKALVPGSRKSHYAKHWQLFDEGDRSPQTLINIGIGDPDVGLDKGQKLANSHKVAFKRATSKKQKKLGEPLIEMNGVTVKYGDRTVLGNWDEQHYLTRSGDEISFESFSDSQADTPGLHWTVRQGERWAIIGPNGSGKTTLLALILSDHPQSYSQPLKLFGRSRLPSPGQPGISVFDIQRRIGHSSPEVHAFFPRTLTVRQTIESAYADTPLLRPKLTVEADDRVSACLRWFQDELDPSQGMDKYLQSESLRHGSPQRVPWRLSESNPDPSLQARRIAWELQRQDEQATQIEWADKILFSDLTFTGQRVALFLRAIVSQPDIVILDEAFSGLDDIVRDKCLLFLEHGESVMLTPYFASHPRRKVYGTRMIPHRRTTRDRDTDGIVIKEGLTDEQALIVVSHLREELPTCIQSFLFLPEIGSGESCRMGYASEDLPLRHDRMLWGALWGMTRTSNFLRSTAKYGLYYPDEATTNAQQSLMQASRKPLEPFDENGNPQPVSRKEPWRLRKSGPKGGRPPGSKDSYQRIVRHSRFRKESSNTTTD